MAWTFATDPDAQKRDGPEAVRLAKMAVAGSHRTNATYLSTLATACAETGQFAEAIAVEQEAIAQSKTWRERSDFTERFALFANHCRYRDFGSVTERARLRLREGQAGQAEVLFEDAIVSARPNLGASNIVLGGLLRRYGDFLLFDEKRPGTATEQYLNALPILRLAHDEILAETLCNLGRALQQCSKSKEAEPYVRDGLRLLEESVRLAAGRGGDLVELGHPGCRICGHRPIPQCSLGSATGHRASPGRPGKVAFHRAAQTL
jgi:tetratricopeptide (TPR) repeat protein